MLQKNDRREIIRDNYMRVVERIRDAAASAGRDPECIRLVIVTKTQPIDLIRSVIEAGATDLGENYIEEAASKIEGLGGYKEIHWHMIGHLQRRKTQNFLRYFEYLHSLDSIKLAAKIDQLASAENRVIPAWLEVNTSGEASKSGWNISVEQHWDLILAEIQEIISLSNIKVLGVMTVPPFSEAPGESRPYFQLLRKFRDHVINNLHPEGFEELSMGMSSDFEVAIEEGSTCVRIGQAIFGPRT